MFVSQRWTNINRKKVIFSLCRTQLGDLLARLEQSTFSHPPSYLSLNSNFPLFHVKASVSLSQLQITQNSINQTKGARRKYKTPSKAILIFRIRTLYSKQINNRAAEIQIPSSYLLQLFPLFHVKASSLSPSLSLAQLQIIQNSINQTKGAKPKYKTISLFMH